MKKPIRSLKPIGSLFAEILGCQRSKLPVYHKLFEVILEDPKEKYNNMAKKTGISPANISIMIRNLKERGMLVQKMSAKGYAYPVVNDIGMELFLGLTETVTDPNYEAYFEKIVLKRFQRTAEKYYKELEDAGLQLSQENRICQLQDEPVC